MTTSTLPDLDGLPELPRDADGPVFAEPWQAQAFAMAVMLREQGHFTWSEWCAAMNREIRAARTAGDPDLGDTYYRHWLAALEALATEKGLTTRGELEVRRDAWDRAHRATPHGEPVHLEAAARHHAPSGKHAPSGRSAP